MTTADILELTKDRLTPRTWHQAGWGAVGVRREGIACLQVAIAEMGTGCSDQVVGPAFSAVFAVIEEQYHDRLHEQGSGAATWAIPFFNHHRDTTLADVHAVLDKARARVESS